MSLPAAILIVLLIAAWICAMGFLVSRAMDADGQMAFIFGVAALLLLLTPLVFAFTHPDFDPNSNQLCLHGHEEWVREWVGKTYTQRKVWACDQWETK